MQNGIGHLEDNMINIGSLEIKELNSGYYYYNEIEKVLTLRNKELVLSDITKEEVEGLVKNNGFKWLDNELLRVW
jgi:hypothetical protein